MPATETSTEGVWTKAWTSDGFRAMAWHHYSGAVWAWKQCPVNWSWALVIRPVGQGETLPRYARPENAPRELRDWAKVTERKL
jgi:hypothetical protein